MNFSNKADKKKGEFEGWQRFVIQSKNRLVKIRPVATEERLTSWARSWCRGGCGSRSTPACVSRCCCCPHPSSASGPRSALLSALGGEISSYSFKTKHTDDYRSSFLPDIMRHAIKEKKIKILNLVYKPLQSIFNVFNHPEIAEIGPWNC